MREEKEDTLDKVVKILEENKDVERFLCVIVERGIIAAKFHGSNVDLGAMVYEIAKYDEKFESMILKVATILYKERANNKNETI